MVKGTKKVVSVTMSMELYEILRLMAEEDSRTISGEIRQILKKYIRQSGLHDDTPF